MMLTLMLKTMGMLELMKMRMTNMGKPDVASRASRREAAVAVVPPRSWRSVGIHVLSPVIPRPWIVPPDCAKFLVFGVGCGPVGDVFIWGLVVSGRGDSMKHELIT